MGVFFRKRGISQVLLIPSCVEEYVYQDLLSAVENETFLPKFVDETAEFNTFLSPPQKRQALQWLKSRSGRQPRKRLF